jgi:hypothetical protein
VFFLNGLFIFCNVTENEAKENARVPLNPARKKDDLANRLPAVMPGLTRHPESCATKNNEFWIASGMTKSIAAPFPPPA